VDVTAAVNAAQPASHEGVTGPGEAEPQQFPKQQQQQQQQQGQQKQQKQQQQQQQQKQKQQQKRKADADASTSSAAANTQRRKGPTMHPANVYAAGEPDFSALAAAHAPLARHLIYPTPAAGSSGSSSSSGRPVIDFTSWEATKELTAALLKVHCPIHVTTLCVLSLTT
jgi:outer membrane biosynthesis protein TonB